MYLLAMYLKKVTMGNVLKATVIGLCFLIGLVFVMGANRQVQAESNATYELVSSSIGPGGTLSAGNYQTDAVIGQAAVELQTAGSYELGSGAWGGGAVAKVSEVLDFVKLYLPAVLR
ncbi:MAG: hypothetical protein ACI9EW_002649 [Cellvibrionaceae bacterium]|jgi:hypothetical protein